MQRVGTLSSLPPVLRELGVDVAALFAAAGLPADALDRADAWVPFQSALKALHMAADRSRRPHIGLLVGQRFQFSQIALLGDLMLNSSSVGDALKSYVVHQRLYSQGFTPYLLAYGRGAEFGFAFYHSTAFSLSAAHDLLLAALVAALRSLVTADWSPVAVHFPRSAPADLSPYREHFRCNLVFDAERASVALRADDLVRAIAGADPIRLRALEQEAIDKLDSNLLPLLYRSLRAMLVTGEPSAARLAQEFAMHERTLARRLRAQGTSFRAVLDEVRYDAARALLVDTSLTITSIAAALGYAEVAPFSKAFHRWSSMAPSDWRAVNRPQSS